MGKGRVGCQRQLRDKWAQSVPVKGAGLAVGQRAEEQPNKINCDLPEFRSSPLSPPHTCKPTMRLIHAATLALVEFCEPNVPFYAILSHTWEDGEVSFQELGVPSSRQAKQGFVKIKKACETTLGLGLE